MSLLHWKIATTSLQLKLLTVSHSLTLTKHQMMIFTHACCFMMHFWRNIIKFRHNVFYWLIAPVIFPNMNYLRSLRHEMNSMTENGINFNWSSTEYGVIIQINCNLNNSKTRNDMLLITSLNNWNTLTIIDIDNISKSLPKLKWLSSCMD